ncbi:MAG: hydantoinase B/oxoprolinase family protein [Alphaproteobacteria bacterium]|nr:hydantoinase B/oxoprolinase family protein [Alphaproteobacteria bacterium]
MAIDRLNLQILAHHCGAAAEAMAYTLMRTAHSTFVKETEDFSCGILTTEGVTFASPKGLGATWYIGLDYGPAIRMIDSYEEGDVCLTNDPYSGFVATHSPDIHIWKPIFWKGELVAFVAGHIHNTDVGGAVPATLSRTLSEVQQEGLRVPPVKILARGKPNVDVLKIMNINVRVPEQNWGDLNAQFASVNVGERKVHEIIERFGLDTFKAAQRELLDYAETQARAIVRDIPDGDYFFSEFADEDSDGGPPCRIAITLRVRGETLELDYTGSDPQLSASLNMPTGGRERHVLPMVGLGYVLYTLNPNLLLNAGVLRVARAILPRGTVVNCEPPAAVGMRSLTCAVTQLCTFGAFARALPERMAASPAGGLSIINVKTTDTTGTPVMASLGPVGGGSGGTPTDDGVEGSGANASFLKNTPVEISESEIPVRFRRYHLWAGSGGPGRFRGGLGTVMEFEVFAPETMVTARNRDRSRFACWGTAGGRAGALSRFVKNPDSDHPVELGNKDIVQCEPGDVLRIVGAGAGGWGSPLDRDPEKVLQDVRCGFVSVAAARADYGVVVAGDAVDAAATTALRAAMRPAASNAAFDYGANRSAFEAEWTEAAYDALTTALARTPVVWRHFLKKAVFAAVERGEHGTLAGAERVRRVVADLMRRYPALGALTA